MPVSKSTTRRTKKKAKGTGAQRRAENAAKASPVSRQEASPIGSTAETALDMPESALIKPIKTSLLFLWKKTNDASDTYKTAEFANQVHQTSVISSGICLDNHKIVEMLTMLQDMADGEIKPSEYLKKAGNPSQETFPFVHYVASTLENNSEAINDRKKLNIFAYAICTKLVLPFLDDVGRAFGTDPDNTRKISEYRTAAEELMKKIPKEDLNDLKSNSAQLLLLLNAVACKDIEGTIGKHFEIMHNTLDAAIGREKAKQKFDRLSGEQEAKKSETDTQIKTESPSPAHDLSQILPKSLDERVENQCKDGLQLIKMLKALRKSEQINISDYTKDQDSPITQKVAEFLLENKTFTESGDLLDMFASALYETVISHIVENTGNYENNVLDKKITGGLSNECDKASEELHNDIETAISASDGSEGFEFYDIGEDFAEKLGRDYVSPLTKELETSIKEFQNVKDEAKANAIAEKLKEEEDTKEAQQAKKKQKKERAKEKAEAARKREAEKRVKEGEDQATMQKAFGGLKEFTHRRKAEKQKQHALHKRAAQGAATKGMWRMAMQEEEVQAEARKEEAATKIQTMIRQAGERQAVKKQVAPIIEVKREAQALRKENEELKKKSEALEDVKGLFRELAGNNYDAYKKVLGKSQILQNQNEQLTQANTEQAKESQDLRAENNLQEEVTQQLVEVIGNMIKDNAALKEDKKNLSAQVGELVKANESWSKFVSERAVVVPEGGVSGLIGSLRYASLMSDDAVSADVKLSTQSTFNPQAIPFVPQQS